MYPSITLKMKGGKTLQHRSKNMKKRIQKALAICLSVSIVFSSTALYNNDISVSAITYAHHNTMVQTDIDNFMATISDSMTNYQKAQAAVKYIAILDDGLTCNKCASDVKTLCDILNIPCSVRYYARYDYATGQNHVNNLIYIEGLGPYIADANVSATYPIFTSVERYDLFENRKGHATKEYCFTIDDGEATITECFMFDIKDVVFPSSITYNGTTYPVRYIHSLVTGFPDDTTIESITIPDGISLLGTDNFKGMINLKTVNLGKNVTELPYMCFYECNNLTTINLENIIAIGDYALSKTGITEANLKNCTSAGSGCLGDCPNLKTIDISSFTSVPHCIVSSYNAESSLESVKLNDNVNELQAGAFAKCKKLTIYVPNSVTSFKNECLLDVGKVLCYSGSACEAYCKENGVNYEMIDGKKNIAEGTLTLEATSYTYTGKEIKPTVTLKHEGKPLTQGTDYTVEYSNNKNAGTATVTVTGKGAYYTGTKTASFVINPRSISGISTRLSGTSFDYTGTSITPALIDPHITIGSANYDLIEGTDYTVAYYNNLNAGQGSAIVTGKGNYTGTATYLFTINPLSLETATVTIPQTRYAYTGAAITPEPTVTLNGKTLTKGTDYNVSYSYNVNGKVWPGSTEAMAYVNIEGINNYKYGASAEFEIYKDESGGTHVHTGWKVETVDPTCTEEGYDSYFCTKCGEYYKLNIKPATGHKWNSGVVTKEATCKTPGVKTYTCTKCGETKTETIPTNSNHSYTSSVTKEATCTESGIRTYKCSLCGDTYTEIIPAKGHRWDSGTVTKAATCTKDGSKTCTCTVCGETTVETIKAKGHKFVDKVVQPTYEEQGYTIHTCSVCGYSYKDSYTDKLTHKDISEATIEVAAVKVYNGKAIKPAVTVKYDTITLVKGTDYVVTYKNNTNCGQATVTVTGKNTYTGNKSATFIVKPKKAVVKSVKSPKTKQLKVTWAKSNGGVTGYQVTIALDRKFTKSKKSYTINKASAKAKTIKKLKKGKTYYVKVRAYKTVNGTKYYGAYSAVKKAKIK